MFLTNDVGLLYLLPNFSGDMTTYRYVSLKSIDVLEIDNVTEEKFF